MMRSMVADGAEDEHITKEHLLETLGMASVADIITTKRLRWVGHALRRHDRDRSRIAVMNELKDTSSTWTKLVMQDCSKTVWNSQIWRSLRSIEKTSEKVQT